jgi:hypothetical protein
VTRDVECPWCNREHRCVIVDWEDREGFVVVTYWCDVVGMEFSRKEER